MVAMQKMFLAQERAAMGMADVASDVRVMRKEQDSHRYDLRLLKANVGELISADRAYALELEHARDRLESSMSRAGGSADPVGSAFDKEQMMDEMMKAMESQMEKMVEERVKAHLKSARIEEATVLGEPQAEPAWSASELNRHYANGTVLPPRNGLKSDVASARQAKEEGDEPHFLALRQEFLKSQLLAERAQGIKNEAIGDATRSLEADLARLERNMLGASRALDRG